MSIESFFKNCGNHNGALIFIAVIIIGVCIAIIVVMTTKHKDSFTEGFTGSSVTGISSYNLIPIGTPPYQLVSITKKVKLRFSDNAQSGKSLKFTPKSLFPLSGDVTAVDANASEISGTAFSWEYNPLSGSISPSNVAYNNLALKLINEAVVLQKWDPDNPSMKWIIPFSGPFNGTIINRSNGYAIESGGGVSAGNTVGASSIELYPDPNKFWKVSVYAAVSDTDLFPVNVYRMPSVSTNDLILELQRQLAVNLSILRFIPQKLTTADKAKLNSDNIGLEKQIQSYKTKLATPAITITPISTTKITPIATSTTLTPISTTKITPIATSTTLTPISTTAITPISTSLTPLAPITGPITPSTVLALEQQIRILKMQLAATSVDSVDMQTLLSAIVMRFLPKNDPLNSLVTESVAAKMAKQIYDHLGVTIPSIMSTTMAEVYKASQNGIASDTSRTTASNALVPPPVASQRWTLF